MSNGPATPEPESIPPLVALEASRGGGELFDEELRALAARLDNDPAFRERWEAVQRWDAAISGAMAAANVPAAMLDRLRARLAEASAEPSPEVAELTPAPVAASRMGRRRWLNAAVAAALALLATAGYFLWPRNQPTIGFDTLALAGRILHGPPAAGALRAFENAEPPRELPASDMVNVAVRPRWWRPAEPFFGREAIAYDITAPGRHQATLVVARQAGWPRDPELAPLPARPLQATLTTAGFSATAWTESGRVYVLIVDGDENDLARYIRAAGALAGRGVASQAGPSAG